MNDQRLTPSNYQPPHAGTSVRPSSEAAHNATPFVWWRSQLVLMMIAFCLLLLGSLLLSWLLPPAAVPSTPTVQGRVNAELNVNSPSANTSDPNEQLSPWQSQQRADARAQAQQILAELIERKRSLESLGVRDWREEEFAAALARAEQGDDLYAMQEFAQALLEYEAARTALQNIEQEIPQIVAQFTQNANQAMQDGRFDLAKQKFAMALRLDANHIPALAGQARLATMPEVLSAIGRADEQQQRYQSQRDISLLQNALTEYQAALALDPLAPTLQDKITATEQLMIEHRFNAAMSQAVQALLAGRYALAQAQFSEALEARPDHSLAKQGLDQALALNKGSSIEQMFAQARASENQENWQQAASFYTAILARDASQVSARSGLVQADVRAQLDAKLRATLAAPLHVTDPERRAEIEQTLAQAKGISRHGEVLNAQIQAIDELLQGAEQLVTVSLTSDSATKVYLLKRGAKPIEYAPFASKILSLPPGRYALSGQRVGYQDVREELVIEPNAKQVLRVDIRSKVAVNTTASAGGDS